jgi:uncharacterized protein (TIGR00369 family)
VTLLERISQRLGPDAAGIELIRALRDEGHVIGMAKTLDMSVETVEDGRVVLASRPSPAVENTNGVAQGGYAASLLDMACGYAIITRLPAGRTCATLELKIAYHKPVRLDAGTLRAEGEVVTLGRRVGFSQARLVDAAGALLSSATSTFIIADIG